MAEPNNKTFPHRIVAYADDEEKNIIEQRLKSSSLDSRSRFLIRSVVEGAIIEIEEPENATGEVEILQEVRDLFKTLLNEVNRAGRNLNRTLHAIELAKFETLRGEEMVPTEELREAAEENAEAAEKAARFVGAIQRKIDAARAEADEHKRRRIEAAKNASPKTN